MAEDELYRQQMTYQLVNQPQEPIIEPDMFVPIEGIVEEEPQVEQAFLVDEETGEAVPVVVVDQATLEAAAEEAVENGEPVVVVDDEAEVDDNQVETVNKTKLFLEAAAKLAEIEDEVSPKDKGES